MILSKLNLACRIGKSITLRKQGVESGTQSIWMQTPYLTDPSPLPDISLRVVPEVLKLADQSVNLETFADGSHMKGAGFRILIPNGEGAPTQPPTPENDLREFSVSLENLDLIVRAAKAGKAGLVVFRVGHLYQAPVIFEIGNDHGCARTLARGVVMQAISLKS